MKTPLLDNFFSDEFAFKEDINRSSCLHKALLDARILSNRDTLTGRVELKHNAPLFPDSWASALLYLILLEQIGTCFNRVDKKTDGNPIYKALRNFTGLDNEGACQAIVALRHSFAHSYSLCNIQKKKDENTGKMEIVENGTHIFTLIADEHSPLITPRNKTWDGTFELNSDEYRTKVNIWKLGDLIEHAFINIKTLYQEDKIILATSCSENELLAKYTVKYN